MSDHEALQLAVVRAGGQTRFARSLKTYQAKVWRWLNVTRRLPAEHVLEVEELWGVSRHELRPDIYPRDERKADAA